MHPTTTTILNITALLPVSGVAASKARPTADTPPPTSGGIEAFEGWMIDRLCELETQFESYVTETSSRFKNDRR